MYLDANLNQLAKLAELGRKYGLRPGVCMFEPRTFPERFFQKYPALRGARALQSRSLPWEGRSSAASPPEFCPGTGIGACVAAVSCNAGCERCEVPTRTGDRCGGDVFVMSRRGRSRYAFTTCGASDNLSIGCDRSGPDIVLAFRVETPGRVNFTFTAPRGVSVYVGYDSAGGTFCRDTTFGGRTCAGNLLSNVRTTMADLSPGTYYFYVATSSESTVIVDAVLP